ncbi:MAG: nucleoside hydrolase, partial [Acidobacteriota bacterium]|nr:nucleoside hydrolase [Acidobacteriota bacterium]
LDTDIGDDIDDAFALALALKSPELEIVGVCIENTVDEREKIALKLIHLQGRDDIPVSRGLGVPGLKGRLPANQASWSIDYDLTKPYKLNAVDFIISKVKQSPGEITLITIGPLTNVAAALRKEPEIKDMIKEIVMMGGPFYMSYGIKIEQRPGYDYNLKCDPEAAKYIFTSGIPITSVGLQVTAHLKLWKENRNKIKNANTPLTNALWELYKLWGSEVPTLHDPLAVAVSIDKTFTARTSVYVEVNDNGDTRVVEGLPSNADICMFVDKNRIIDFFMNRILS